LTLNAMGIQKVTATGRETLKATVISKATELATPTATEMVNAKETAMAKEIRKFPVSQ